MFKCCYEIIYRIKKCFHKYSTVSFNDTDEKTLLKKNRNLKIYQISSSNKFVPQGDFTKMENYDIFYSFLQKPLVKIYIEEIFRPNKEIKSFQIEKVRGIYNQIKNDLEELFKRLGMTLFIPKEIYKLVTFSFDLTGNPATEDDLDAYTPLFLMEWWIYGKSFIKQSKLDKIILLHDIKHVTSEKTQDRAGCPDYNNTRSIILSVKETNIAYIRIVLHHEFFHYIDYADDFSYDDDGWEELNEEGFTYGEGGDTEREWIKLEKDAIGFINHYSTSALEEDRAEIYQYLISCPDEALNNNDYIVSNKAKRMQEFLNTFDKKGIGNPKNNFWANLIDFRKNYIYKEPVFQGNVFNIDKECK